MRRIIGIFALAILTANVPAQVQPKIDKDATLIAIIGDMGTGSPRQYQIAEEMVKTRQSFPFETVITVGDNIYGSEGTRDMEKKFSIPYKPLLDAGVKFYASLGNHDNPTQRFYEPYNMNGNNYYTFKKGNARFFALDSNYMDPKQLEWLEGELKKSSDNEWKIPFFHHPLYSSGGRHGSDTDLRLLLEPLFVKYGVDVVFAGHEHFYERIKPQNGISYFITGSAGQLRRGDLQKSNLTAKGYDADNAFVLAEFDANSMNFYAITRTGEVVDSGTIHRNVRITTDGQPAEKPASVPASAPRSRISSNDRQGAPAAR
jgi:predicted phosphodiesterase